MTVLGSTFNKLKSFGKDVGLVYCIKAQSGCAEKQKTFFFQRFALGMFTSEPKQQDNWGSTLYTDTDN